ncbi:hypothetical protein RHGRI_034786 [Rhododendron griersonianum]|uniref:Uncharacterized protein n=1 Tax=Rhododendron griersonianum TaxID=479676 RepID=A0AAV6I2M6_9ERIC|nr:hypothetical protein RHGRI_034786 [Rhododendron griersonianum]
MAGEARRRLGSGWVWSTVTGCMDEAKEDENSIADLPSSVCNLIHLKSLCLDNNKVKQMEGFQEFETRRRKKFDKQIDANVMISSKGLDEGVDL